jgi:hypothetical protein
MTKSFLVLLSAASFLAFTQSANAQTPPAPPTGGTPAAPSRPQPVAAPFATVGGFSLSGYCVRALKITTSSTRPTSTTITHLPASTANRGRSFHAETRYSNRFAAATAHQFARTRESLRRRVDFWAGANYFAANGNQDGALNVKQAFVRFKGAVGQGSAARLGRFEFSEGVETVNPNATLNFLEKRSVCRSDWLERSVSVTPARF